MKMIQLLLLFTICSQIIKGESNPYVIQEYRSNYFILGKPDTKIQFSFKFKLLKENNFFFGYTQIMFWKLAQKDSNPFYDINFTPEFYFQFNIEDDYLIKTLNLGYAHFSNGRDSDNSRSIDSLYIDLFQGRRFKNLLNAEFVMRIQHIFNEDKTNKDISKFYGPINFKVFLNQFAEDFFSSEELYLEYYNGGHLAEDFDKSSFRISLRSKPWKSGAAKIFFQYFNGYAENLLNYNIKQESYRIGISLGEALPKE